jgi:RNA polymerase sigma-70 factor (ECF subfamily)
MADDSFASFYASSYRRLLGQLFALTGDLAEAENLLQEAYARAFVRWPRVGAYDRPEAWVRRVAINLAAMADRSLRRRVGPAGGRRGHRRPDPPGPPGRPPGRSGPGWNGSTASPR